MKLFLLKKTFLNVFTSLTLTSGSLQRLRRNVNKIRQTATSETVPRVDALGIWVTIVASGFAFVFELMAIAARPMDRIWAAILESQKALAPVRFFGVGANRRRMTIGFSVQTFVFF